MDNCELPTAVDQLSLAPSKSALKKQQKAAEKEQRKAETQARLDSEQQARAQPDFAADNYGHLPLNQSTTRGTATWTQLCEIGESTISQPVRIRARLHNSRSAGKTIFVVLRQQYHTLQAVASVNDTAVSKQMIKFISAVPKESIVDVCGRIVRAAVPVESCSQHDVELVVERFHVFSSACEVLPFQLEDACKPEPVGDEPGADAVRVGLDTRLNNRIIDLRIPSNQAIFAVQSAVCELARTFFLSHGFVEIHTPKIISAASEGGSNVFCVSYFKTQAYLAQSPQLYKQMAICSDFGRVFEIGPVFRAENSFTHRHMTEFVGIDLEMAFNEHYHEVMDLIGDMFVQLFDGLKTRFAREIAAVRQQYPSDEFLYLPKTLVLRYSEAIEMLRAAGHPELGDHDDISTEQEKLLGRLVRERYATDFYALDKFPLAVRPFYTMPDPALPGYANAYDFFMRGEEILSGAQRVHDYAMLVERATEHKIDLATIQAYLDTFKYGAPAHAGGGIGLERIVLLYFALGNIRRSSMFPRDPKRITP